MKLAEWLESPIPEVPELAESIYIELSDAGCHIEDNIEGGFTAIDLISFDSRFRFGGVLVVEREELQLPRRRLSRFQLDDTFVRGFGIGDGEQFAEHLALSDYCRLP